MLARIAFEVQVGLRSMATMLTRRQFLESGCAAAAASGAAALIGDAQAEVPAGESEYRALVCVVLGGGADSFNMLVPTDTPSYRLYAERRGNLALNRDDLLSLSGGDRDGRSYGLHQGMREVHSLYAGGEVALLANVGVLQGPVRRMDANSALELSHSDLIARWHHGTADNRSNSGWAGRVADVLADRGGQGVWGCGDFVWRRFLLAIDCQFFCLLYFARRDRDRRGRDRGDLPLEGYRKAH